MKTMLKEVMSQLMRHLSVHDMISCKQSMHKPMYLTALTNYKMLFKIKTLISISRLKQSPTITKSEDLLMILLMLISRMSESNHKDPLSLIIIGVAGTGKSYLINALRNLLQNKCTATATTGNAS